MRTPRTRARACLNRELVFIIMMLADGSRVGRLILQPSTSAGVQLRPDSRLRQGRHLGDRACRRARAARRSVVALALPPGATWLHAASLASSLRALGGIPDRSDDHKILRYTFQSRGFERSRFHSVKYILSCHMAFVLTEEPVSFCRPRRGAAAPRRFRRFRRPAASSGALVRRLTQPSHCVTDPPSLSPRGLGQASVTPAGSPWIHSIRTYRSPLT